MRLNQEHAVDSQIADDAILALALEQSEMIAAGEHDNADEFAQFNVPLSSMQQEQHQRLNERHGIKRVAPQQQQQQQREDADFGDDTHSASDGSCASGGDSEDDDEDDAASNADENEVDVDAGTRNNMQADLEDSESDVDEEEAKRDTHESPCSTSRRRKGWTICEWRKPATRPKPRTETDWSRWPSFRRNGYRRGCRTSRLG